MARMTQIGKAIEDSVDTLTDVDTAIPTSAAVIDEIESATGNYNPTLIATTVASKGGVFNGGFELGSGTTSTSLTFVGSENYGWQLWTFGGTMTALYDTAVTHSGKQSMKLSATTTSSNGAITLYYSAAGTKYFIPVKSSTKYRLSGFVKTYNVPTDGAYIRCRGYDSSAGTTENNYCNKLTGTNDWTYCSVEFTTTSTTILLNLYGDIGITGNVCDAWFDDIKLEEVIEDTSNTSMIPTPLLSTIVGVTSTDNIDQINEPSIAANQIFGGDGSISAPSKCAIKFTPTRNKFTGVYVKPAKVGTGQTADVTVSIVNDSAGAPGTTIIASVVIAQATWNAYPDNVFTPVINLPCLLTAGTSYWIVFAGGSSTTNYTYIRAGASGGNGSMYYSSTWNANTLGSIYKTVYAKPTENATIICNGERISLSTNEDGLLSGAIIDLDKGKYSYDSGVIGASNDNFSAFCNNVYSASAGGESSGLMGIYGWKMGTATQHLVSLLSTTARNVVVKVNTMLPIKHLKIISGNYENTTDQTIDISTDNVNWTTLYTSVAASAVVTKELHTNMLNGITTFYIRINKGTTNGYSSWHRLLFDADLDTSSISLPLIYPLSTNQFTEEVVLPSTATRVYYRTSKFAKCCGTIMPHLEFTDGSGNYIAAVPCKIDNTGETNPAINIVIADTTYGQQSGTGSNDSTTGYILNDGEYMTFSTTTAEPKVTYKVGSGTTSFSNITKNRIYLSSNGSSNSATKDPSHQMGVNLWYRVQSVVRAVSDLTEKVNKVITGTDYSEGYIEPVLTWSGTAPPITRNSLRWIKVGKMVYIEFYYQTTDGNGNTSLTVALPFKAKSEALSLNSHLQSFELVGSTYSNPYAYVAQGASVITFANLAALTDATTVYIQCSGWYPTD